MSEWSIRSIDSEFHAVYDPQVAGPLGCKIPQIVQIVSVQRVGRVVQTRCDGACRLPGYKRVGRVQLQEVVAIGRCFANRSLGSVDRIDAILLSGEYPVSSCLERIPLESETGASTERW